MVATLEKWHLVCPRCGFERSSLEPRINQLQTINEADREASLRPIRERNFDVLIRWLQHEAGDRLTSHGRPRLLEVGCAHGWFLERARTAFDVLGIEPDNAIAAATKRKGLSVTSGFFPDALEEGAIFDVIVFNDVLEHIPDVRSVLRECVTRLAEKGVIVVNAPDRRGLFYRLSKVLARLGQRGPFHRMWQAGMPSPHLYYFDSASIDGLARQCDLRIVASRPLDSLMAKGLHQRIRYAGKVSLMRSLLLTAGVFALLPCARLFRSDINVWMLEKYRPE